MSSLEPRRWAALHARATADQKERLAAAFDGLLERAALPAEALRARPAAGGWSGTEVLEHVALVHRFTFVLIDKIAARSRARLARGEAWPTAPPALDAVARLADPTWRWPHPPHMTPRGSMDPREVAERLALDRARLLAWLSEMPSGEGTLHRVRMSRVEGDDRLDLYQWVELVLRHAERHALQIDRAYGAR